MKKIFLIICFSLANIFAFSFTLLQDLGVSEYNDMPFMSRGQVLDISDNSYVKSPIEGNVFSIIDNKLENNFGKFEVNNLLLIEGNNKNIIGIYNIECKGFNTGDKIIKNQILGKKNSDNDPLIFIYLEYSTVYFDERIFLVNEMTEEMIEILNNQDYIWYKFNDFFDYKNIITASNF